MNTSLLHILECPFCGGGLRLQPSPAAESRGTDVLNGILSCDCCAYPVVDGIPFIRVGPTANAAMDLLGAGRRGEALTLLLDLKESDRAARFAAMLADAQNATFRTALDVLSRDAEGVYLLYRFSDPTFLCTRAVLRALGNPDAGRVLDVCGGAGHLARGAGSEVVVTDIAFWKLWLAKRFVAPGCEPVCCDAGVPLPFSRAAFSLTYCSDALHYVWPRRLLAGEMMRATAAGGTVVASHLHNALCENHSPGMPLTPAGYRHLFREREPSLFKEQDVLDAIVARRGIDLTRGHSDADLAEESALILIAGAKRRQSRDSVAKLPGNLEVNPLYVSVNGSRTLELRFPSDFYAEEFGACRRYLPEQVELPEDWAAKWGKGEADERIADLVSRHVLLDLPERYL